VPMSHGVWYPFNNLNEVISVLMLSCAALRKTEETNLRIQYRWLERCTSRRCRQSAKHGAGEVRATRERPGRVRLVQTVSIALRWTNISRSSSSAVTDVTRASRTRINTRRRSTDTQLGYIWLHIIHSEIHLQPSHNRLDTCNITDP